MYYLIDPVPAPRCIPLRRPSPFAALLCTLFLILIFPIGTAAQPELTIVRTTVRYPKVEHFISVRCDSVLTRAMTRQNFRLFDDGVERYDFVLFCPALQCEHSLALVLDGSNSMSGGANAAAIQGALSFVGLMYPDVDEAAVIHFDQNIRLVQSMTTDKAALSTAIAQLPASGHTGWRDAMYAGIQEIVAHARYDRRALIIVTNGGDNSSFRTVSQVIDSARAHAVRVFPILIGGGARDYQSLMDIADTTGGRCYIATDTSMVKGFFEAVFDNIKACECSIVYQIDCAHGGRNEVELQLNDFCKGSDTAWTSYQVPLLPQMFKKIYMDFGSATTYGNRDVTIPLSLRSPLPGTWFHPFSFLLRHDVQRMPLVVVRIPPASVLQGMSVTTAPTFGGTRVALDGRNLLDRHGVLLEFTFHPPPPPQQDTVCSEIWTENPLFAAGCLDPILDTGSICVLPDRPDVRCEASAPARISWSRKTNAYVPDPFVFAVSMENAGSLPATRMTARIDADTSVFLLRDPAVDTLGIVRDTLAAGQSVPISWILETRSRATQTTTTVCLTASFANHPDVVCCAEIVVDAAGAELSCVMQLPVLQPDSLFPRYNPSPFVLDVHVENRGVADADSVVATISLPPDLALAGADAPDRTSKLLAPSMLRSRESGAVRWQLAHAPTAIAHGDAIRVLVSEKNGSGTECVDTLTIPAVRTHRIAAECLTPDSLQFDHAIGDYVPNPFPVQLQCRNFGIETADSISATIILPPEILLDPPTQPMTRPLSPESLSPWNPGDPSASAGWTLRWTDRKLEGSQARICFVVTAISDAGVRFDTARSCCTVSASGVDRALWCELVLPDSVRLNAHGSLEPNPFPVRYTIRNDGSAPEFLDSLALELPPDGLSLHPTSPNPRARTLGFALQPGESRSFDWLVFVRVSFDRRTAHLLAWVTDAQGRRIPCEGTVSITALPVPDLVCALEIPAVMADISSGGYEPRDIPVTVTLTNTTNALTDTVRVTLVPPAGYRLSPADAAGSWTRTIQPAQLFAAQTGSARWLLAHDASDVERMELIQVLVASGNSGSSSCDGYITLPALNPSYEVTLAADGPLQFCEGFARVLDAGAPFVEYRWNTGDSTRHLVVRSSGSYFCTVRRADGLVGRSDTVQVVVHPLPPTPVITRAGDVLRGSGTAGLRHQWYRDGQPITAATADTLLLPGSGAYALHAFSAEGCESVSPPFAVSVLAVYPAVAADRYMLHSWPEPAEDAVQVELRVPAGQSATLLLIDVLGRAATIYEGVPSEGFLRLPVTLRGRAPGPWLLLLRSGDVWRMRRVTKL
jgi:Mg-chelatase subunit ChlD